MKTRHDHLKDYLVEILKAAGFVDVEVERWNADGGRSDIVALDPISGLKHHLDVTIVHPLKASRTIPAEVTVRECEQAELRKRKKYNETAAQPGTVFTPLAAEVYGRMASGFGDFLKLCAKKVVGVWSRNLSPKERKRREVAVAQMWLQTISVLIQRNNCYMIRDFVFTYKRQLKTSNKRRPFSKLRKVRGIIVTRAEESLNDFRSLVADRHFVDVVRAV